MSDDSDKTVSQLCEKLGQASLNPGDPDSCSQELLFKGKPRLPKREGCQESTKEVLKALLQQRQPPDFKVDLKTLDTPIHAFLGDPKNAKKSGCELAALLSKLLTDLGSMNYLHVYINMPNIYGRTPLSMCLKSENFVDLISPLIQNGAQLHHLCGRLSDRCNHLHYAMLKSSPATISATLDEMFCCHPFGSDGMYAVNKRLETPKAALLRRIQEQGSCPSRQQELSCILGRIQGYPPVDGAPEFCDSSEGTNPSPM